MTQDEKMKILIQALKDIRDDFDFVINEGEDVKEMIKIARNTLYELKED